MGGEVDTRAEPTLTISIEFYLSPPGKPGRKKEDRQVRTLWSVIRGDALGSKPQGSLRAMEVGPLPPEDIHPQIPSRPWDKPRGRLQGAQLLSTEEDEEEVERRVLGRR